MANATCALTDTQSATGGSVTLTTASASVIAGTFDLTFAGEAGTDHITGSFSAPICAALDTQLNTVSDGGAPAVACKM